MPGRSSDGARRLVEFESLRDFPVEVEEFDSELSDRLSAGRLYRGLPGLSDVRRRPRVFDLEDARQKLQDWFRQMSARVPYPLWFDELHRVLDAWSSQGCTLSPRQVRVLEDWSRECQALAGGRALHAVDRPAKVAHPGETTRRIHLRVSSAPVVLREDATSGSSPTVQVVKVSAAAVAKSQQLTWWQRTRTELYWLAQMLIGRREGPDGKPQSYPWSPFREWANDAEKIPFNPVPAEAIAGAMEGDLRPAVKEGALRALTGGLSKYTKAPKSVLRFADEPVTFTRKMLNQSKEIARGRGIQKVETLVSLFGGTAKGWVKKKGWDEAGREWHWYEHHGIGRVGVKPAGNPDPF